MTLEPLFPLLRLFDQYQQDHDPADLHGFAHWLQVALPASEAEAPPPDTALAELLRRFEKHSHRYARLALRNLPISSHDDLALLTAIGKLGTPSKNEVYQATVMEVTTGAQILRRLARLGLVDEFADTVDRRVRRVHLTGKGRTVQQEAAAAFAEVARLKLAPLGTTQRAELLGLLRTLDAFHQTLAETHREADLDALRQGASAMQAGESDLATGTGNA